MDTYKKEGRRLTHTNSTSTAISSGDVVVMAKGIGVAVVDIAVAASGEIEIEKVHTLAALTTESWSMGEQLYWDATNLRLTKTAAAHNKAGMAAAAKLAGAAYATADVKLNVNVV